MKIYKISDYKADQKWADTLAKQISGLLAGAHSMQERFVPEPRLKNTGIGYMKSKGAEEFSKKSAADILTSKPWLQSVDWQAVEYTNESLCRRGRAQYGNTSDGYEEARNLWESKMSETMSLEEALDVCFQCHRTAPFLNFNGNTFPGIAKTIVSDIVVHLGGSKGLAFESVVGHYVAGTEGRDALLKAIAEIKTRQP